jgi:branched-chain amino acid transport system permease protein
MTAHSTDRPAGAAVAEQAPVAGGADHRGGRPTTRWAAAALLVLVAAVLPVVLPALTGLLVIAGIFFVVVLGLPLLMGHAGQVSLGQTLFMAIGGYGAGLLALRAHWPTTLSAIAMAVVSALVALVLGRLFLRLRGYYFALATLGLAVMTQSLSEAWSGVTAGPSGLVAIPSLQIAGRTIFTDQANYYLLLVVGLLGAAFVANVQRSQTGRALLAVGADPGAAAMLGINAARYRTTAFVVAAVFASLGGSLYAFYLRFFSPDMISVPVAFSIVIMVALGGSRTLAGPLLGALVLQGLPIAGQSFALWEPLAAGVLLILVMTYLPRGMWGSLTEALRRAAARRSEGR